MSSAPNSSDSAPLRIAVAGAGAIGCTLAAMLARAGQSVSLLARGDTLKAVQANGIQLQRQGQTWQVPVQASDDAKTLGVQDVLFLCAKSQDLASLAQASAALIGPDTWLVPMVNGVPWWYFERLPGPRLGHTVKAVDPQAQLATLLPPSQVIGVVQFMAAERLSPGVVVSNNPMLLILGEIDHRHSERVQRLAGILSAAGIEGRPSDQIRDPLWMKIIANLTTNPLSVVAGATLQDMYGDPRLLPVTRQTLFEGMALAASYGARLPLDPPTIIAETVAMGPVRTSMLQDYQQGNPLELAAIGDAVLELADAKDIPMPMTRHIVAMANFRGEAARR